MNNMTENENESEYMGAFRFQGTSKVTTMSFEFCLFSAPQGEGCTFLKSVFNNKAISWHVFQDLYFKVCL